MQYSLVPGTNQLITSYPGQGSQLFNQYGYNIRHPRYRDYYNMLRGNQGLSFADSLAQLLTKIWPTGPHATGLPATASLPAAASAAAPYVAPGAIGSPLYNPASIFNSSNELSAAIKNSTSNYAGQFGNGGGGQWPSAGPDPLTRLGAYHELLRHMEWRDAQERNPRLFITNTYLLPTSEFEYQDDQSQLPAPAVPDNFFAAHKHVIIGVAIAIAAVVLYLKLK
jgi:hypothetical protein